MRLGLGPFGGWPVGPLLLEGGEVCSFGEGDEGALALGHGAKAKQCVPTLVLALQGKHPVVQASAGGSHSLALSEGGEVYSFGRGLKGQLGRAPRCKAHGAIPSY